jgi:hypothetical protein
MRTQDKSDPKSSPAVVLFYHSYTFPYLMAKWHQEIGRRIKDVPNALREQELVPYLAPLGETSGYQAWQVFRTYLDRLEDRVAEIVRRHSPSFWFHLHRRIRPMLAEIHESKTDDTTVALVRNIAELAYGKYGQLDRTDDLGPINKTRLETFLDGAWYEATAHALESKLKAKQLYQKIKGTKQVVMTDFRVSDLCDAFGVEGLCYEYWWASAAARAIGKGSIVKWDATKSPPLRYKDSGVFPGCFDFYDQRNYETKGFYTRLGTWLDKPDRAEKVDASRRDQIHFAQLTPNPSNGEYPVWNSRTRSFSRGYGATNFDVGTFSLAAFKNENNFMSEPFKRRHGIDLDVVLFAIWAASFFAVYTGNTSHLSTEKARLDRTMQNLGNLLFRGYSMVALNLEQFTQEAVWWANALQHEQTLSVDEVQEGVKFITLSETTQKNIGLWSGGKRPIVIPSMDGLMIDLAAIIPFLYTIFFGLRKVPQVGGETFEQSVRTALRRRNFDVCLQGNYGMTTRSLHMRAFGFITTPMSRSSLTCATVQSPMKAISVATTALTHANLTFV